MEERRQAKRLRVLKGGKLFFNEGRSTVDCVVRQLSETGARLKLASTGIVPNRFDLLIDRENRYYPAELVWRDMTNLGVRFTGGPKDMPSRQARRCAHHSVNFV